MRLFNCHSYDLRINQECIRITTFHYVGFCYAENLKQQNMVTLDLLESLKSFLFFNTK